MAVAVNLTKYWRELNTVQVDRVTTKKVEIPIPTRETNIARAKALVALLSKSKTNLFCIAKLTTTEAVYEVILA